MNATRLMFGAMALGFVIPATNATAATKYTTSDIQALIAQENWAEALEHMTDIPPSKRDAEWRKSLEKAAIAQVSGTLTSAQGYEARGVADSILARYPDLKKSKEYLKVRGDAGLKYFEQCFANPYAGPQCAEDIIKFVASDPTNDDLAFRAGKMTRIGAGYGPATIIFEMAFRNKERRKDCADQQVVLAIPMTLGNLRDEPVLGAAKKVAFDYCWEPLKSHLLAEFHEAGSYYLESTCPMFTSKKALTPFQSALCADALASKKK